MHCTIEGCENDPSLKYTWAWGEEGVCCDAHRSSLESQASQLGRAITFAPLAADSELRPYNAPQLTRLDPEVGKLRMDNAELVERLKAANARIGELELHVFELETKLDETKPGPTLTVVEGEAPPREG